MGSPTDNATPTAEVAALREQVTQLKHELEWFRKQLFGSKSEKRLEDCPDQLRLFGQQQTPVPENQPTQNITYQCGKGKKQRGEDCVNEQGLRFDDSVPMKTIVLPVLETRGLRPDEYEVIGNKVFHKLADYPVLTTKLSKPVELTKEKAL